jgi:2-polyprenyl-3-methyl-5-hydroxy-6-metoxy-1,4-benzoquinol methylase
LSLPAAQLGAKVLATDWSPKMIERAAVSPDDATAIIRCEYARENSWRQALAAGWCATGIIFVGAEDNGLISAVS